MKAWHDAVVKRLKDQMDDDEDDELVWQVMQSIIEPNTARQSGGSLPGRRPNLPRDRVAAHQRLYEDYFSQSPLYNAQMFRRRFRMRRELFQFVMDGVVDADNYFVQRLDAVKVLGLSTIQKCTAAMRMLCYGLPADALDEYLKIGESTAIEAFKVTLLKNFDAVCS